MRAISKRIDYLENKLTPKIHHLVVIAQKGETREQGILRVMHKQHIEILPDDCFVIYLNLHRRRKSW